MMVMKIDFKKLATLLLPTFLRKGAMQEFARVLMSPMETIHTSFHTQRDKKLYELQHTPQICYIKDALDDEFGITDYAAGFDIEDVDARGNWQISYDETEAYEYMHLMAEDEENFIVWDEDEITIGTYSFVVKVPSSYYSDSNNIITRSVVDKYRLASRKYKLQIK